MKTIELKHPDGFCTPEQGGKLDELLTQIDVQAESHMVWWRDALKSEWTLYRRQDVGGEMVSAYSGVDLGVLLAGYKKVKGLQYVCVVWSVNTSFSCAFEQIGDSKRLLGGEIMDGECEAQAKADLTIKGLEEGWINQKNIGE